MQNKIKISVVGLGYVGLPLAIAFAEKGFNVAGFDLNQSKIDKYLQGIDPTNEVGNDKIKNVKNRSINYYWKKYEKRFNSCL